MVEQKGVYNLLKFVSVPAKMKLGINKVFTRIGTQFGVTVVQVLKKECSIRSLCNITNVPKTYKKEIKPNLFIRKKLKDAYNSTKDIGIQGCLLLSIPISTFILGTWQMQRQKWKLDLIKKLNSHINQQPVELPENLEELQSMEYHPIKVKGTFLYDKEFIVGFRSLLVDGKPSDSPLIKNNKSQTGYHVITPFKLADRDLTILVNRGWIPKSYKKVIKKLGGPTNDGIEIIGILRPHESRPQFVPKNCPENDVWHYRDLNEMAKIAGTEPIYIEMIYNRDAPQYPIGGQTKVSLRNEHLSYIITWYSLSIITAYMWYKRFIH